MYMILAFLMTLYDEIQMCMYVCMWCMYVCVWWLVSLSILSQSNAASIPSVVLVFSPMMLHEFHLIT